jgi:GMP synthase (glutamine-hydrolysing)
MILIIDFGSQYNQLIARRVRELKVYCQIAPPTIPIDEVKALAPDGIILSGGPSSIYEENSPKIDPAIFKLGIPILGICYGMHYMTDALGGKVSGASKREYGFASLRVKRTESVFNGIAPESQVWMSHGDSVTRLPRGFRILATTENTPRAAIHHPGKRLFGLQFHPEVQHTKQGKRMIGNFLFKVCRCKRDWTMESFARRTVEEIRETVGDRKVILGLSGGVDSSVAALLIHRAVGKQLTCIFVDNGVLRKDEATKLRAVFKEKLNMNIRFARAANCPA